MYAYGFSRRRTDDPYTGGWPNSAKWVTLGRVDDSVDAFADSLSLRLCRALLGETVAVIVDRPLGSLHPTAGFAYELNYGFIPGILAPDGESLDAYVVGCDTPVTEARGRAIAVVHRLFEDDDKLIVATDGFDRGDDVLHRLVAFQESGRPYRLLRSRSQARDSA